MPNQPSAQGEQPPPDLPAMPDVPNALSNYLRSFSLWCRNGFRDKMPLNSAAPGVMLQAYDAPPGTPPNVFEFEVSQAGVAALAPVSLGGGALGTPVPFYKQWPSIAFSAYMSAGQSIPASVYTVLNFDVLDFSVGGGYSTTSHRFQPNVAGYYQFNLSVGSATGSVTGLLLAGLFKNGAEVARGMQLNVAAANYYFNHISRIIHLNGITDYVEGRAYFGSVATAGPEGFANYFDGALVVPA